jgi:hypothetical protein
MKERLKKEYNRRLRMVLKFKLNAKNTVTVIGAVVVPVLRYSFDIVNWRLEEIRKIDRKTRNALTLYKMHHPKADIDRLYLKRTEGGRGPLQSKATCRAEKISIAEYLNTNIQKTSKYVNL